MALVLNLKLNRSFFANDVEYKLVQIKAGNRLVLEKQGAMNQRFEVDAMSRQQLESGIFCMAAPGSDSYIGRVALEAPKDVKILRDNLYADKDTFDES